MRSRVVGRRRDFALAILAVTLAAAARAADAPCDSTETCLRALAAAQESTRTIDARFVQTKHLALLDEPLVSTGRFRFRRPDRMRIDVEKPRALTIVVAGDQLTVPGMPERERRAMAGSPMAGMFREIGALFAGQLAKPPPGFAMDARAADGGVEVRLTPTAAEYQQLFQRIALRFHGRDLTLQAMRLDEALGDRLEIELRDVQRNVELPDDAFQPPG